MTTIAINPENNEVLTIFRNGSGNDVFDAFAEKEPDAFIESLDNMTIKQLTAIHNSLTGAELSKFSTKSAAIDRVRDDLVNAMDEQRLEMFDGKANGKGPSKAPANDQTSNARSAGAARSWKDPVVAERRSQRHGVKVGGEEFRSVLAAFKALKLPVEKHIKFRKELKETSSGRKVFKAEDGTKHNFTLVS